MQYLTDLHAVHAALEGAIAAAAAAAVGLGAEQLRQAADLFSTSSGLDRADQLAADLHAMLRQPGGAAAGGGSSPPVCE